MEMVQKRTKIRQAYRCPKCRARGECCDHFDFMRDSAWHVATILPGVYVAGSISDRDHEYNREPLRRI
jgi:hypothetical protein